MMARRGFLARLTAWPGGVRFGMRARPKPRPASIDVSANPGSVTVADLTNAEWRQRLTPDQYHVLREAGTERRGSSRLNHEKREGDYVCAGCGQVLFHSKWKYNSGTGWPSFFDVIHEHIGTKDDHKLFVTRTAYHCARCGGHQGHVFDDGPQPTGLRYCNNGCALEFHPTDA